MQEAQKPQRPRPAPRPREAADAREPVPPAQSSQPAPPRAQAQPPAPAQAQPPAQAPAGGGPVSADVVRQRWPEILETVKGQRRVAWMLLSNATVHSVEDGVLTVLFAREGEARGFSASGYDRDLVTALGSVLGTNLRIKALSSARLAASPGAPRSGHGGPDELSARAPSLVESPAPASGSPPPRTLSPEAQQDSAPVQPPSADLTGMDLIKRELGGRVIAEIDET